MVSRRSGFRSIEHFFKKYIGISARQSEPPPFCTTRFKGGIALNTSHSTRIAAKNPLDKISQKIPHSFQWRKLNEQIMHAYIHRKRFCLLSWTIYLVTLRHTWITWHSSYTSAKLLKKLMARGRWWNSLHDANKVVSAEKTPGKSFNRCLT